MKLAFTLSMPSVASWNGRWSGEGRVYARVRSVRSTKKNVEKFAKLVAAKSFHYSFGDGWSARVEVREVSDGEARCLTRDTQGFCGYDWMIDSILEYGDIRVPERCGA